MNPEIERVYVSAKTYVRIEEALGAKVLYSQIVGTDGEVVASGILLMQDFLPDLVIVPHGGGCDPVSRIVDVLSGGK